MNLARISHHDPSRGRREAAVAGCTDQRSAPAWFIPRQAGRR